MFTFKTTDTVAYRVQQVVNSHIGVRGEAWLLQLGYQECNDYADQVRQIVSFSSNNEFIRFETVARRIRTIKAKLRAKQPTV